MFDNLGISKSGKQQPARLWLIIGLNPLAKVGGQSIIVVLQTIRTKDRHKSRGKSGLELLNNGVGYVLGTRPKLNDREEFGYGITGRPYPDILLSMPDIRPQFIELDVYELDMFLF